MRKKRDFRRLMIYYFIFWILGIILFWKTDVNQYLIIYSLTYFIIGLPIMTILISMLMVVRHIVVRHRWVLIIFFGTMYMLADFFTFILANMLAYNRKSWPDIDSFIIGAICTLIGLFIGTLLYRQRRKTHRQ